MSIKVSTLKASIWFLATMLIALSFPIQVFAGNPYPALAPYGLIGLALFLDWAIPVFDNAEYGNRYKDSWIDQAMVLYVALVLFNTGWQMAFGFISPVEGVSVFANFLLPTLCYWYFRRQRFDCEIRAVLLAIAVAGLIVGVYFAYDSYVKLALGQVGEYATRAFQYSLDRANITAADANNARVRVGFRSFGLLETHSVSGAWVVLGTFATLALIPRHRQMARRFAVLIFAALLLVGLNFTSLVAFAAIILLFEFSGLRLIRGRLSARIVSNIAWLAIIVTIMATGVIWAIGDLMAEFLIENLTGQTNLAIGRTGGQVSMVTLTLANILGYSQHILDYPLSLLTGDGFSSYGIAKGGDVGWIESLARLGLPFFLLAVLGLVRLLISAMRTLGTGPFIKDRHERFLDPGQILEFACCVTLLVFVTEIHYTVWTAKAVLPVLFLALAFFRRYPGEMDNFPAHRQSSVVGE